ncbi:MAG: hypothetical protein PUD02_07100 [Eggerthellales bacterium]|nr:hypothetical protein [Eggerthellales bacterium]
MVGLYGWALYCGIPVGCVYGPEADPYGRWVCFQDLRLEGRARTYAGSTLSELLREIEDGF